MADLADMGLFVRAVQAGSLSAAGRELGCSPAAASKRLMRLEASLGVRLLQRSSRRLALTDEGAIYFERCQLILADVADAEAAISLRRRQPHGVLRVSSPVALGRRWVGPALAKIAARHPELGVQLSLSDSLVDLIESGFDCAVRIGGPEDSRLIGRLLAENRRVVCASPAYLRRRGRPRQPADLAAHDCLLMETGLGRQAEWSFSRADAAGEPAQSVRVQGRLQCDNGEQIHDWALAGLGIARRSYWDVCDELASGRLVELLPGWISRSAPIQLVYPSRRLLPARTRLLIDSLVEHFGRAA